MLELQIMEKEIAELVKTPELSPLETMRHSCAHIMAHAITRLYPGSQFGVGPHIENGFYYDVKFPVNVTEEILPKIEAEMKKMAEKSGKTKEWAATGGMAAVLAASNLAGFSAYLVATSSLAALTGSLGIALPFAAYAGLTTALSVVLGPVGWLGAGLFALIGLTGANYKKLIPAILYISVLRNEQA